jgi:hypothetical protein
VSVLFSVDVVVGIESRWIKCWDRIELLKVLRIRSPLQRDGCTAIALFRVKLDRVLVWYKNGIVVVVDIGENERGLFFAAVRVPLITAERKRETAIIKTSFRT